MTGENDTAIELLWWFQWASADNLDLGEWYTKALRFLLSLGNCGNPTLPPGAFGEQENDPKSTAIFTKNLKNLLIVLLMSPWNDRLELRVGDLMSSWMWISTKKQR